MDTPMPPGGEIHIVIDALLNSAFTQHLAKRHHKQGDKLTMISGEELSQLAILLVRDLFVHCNARTMYVVAGNRSTGECLHDLQEKFVQSVKYNYLVRWAEIHSPFDALYLNHIKTFHQNLTIEYERAREILNRELADYACVFHNASLTGEEILCSKWLSNPVPRLLVGCKSPKTLRLMTEHSHLHWYLETNISGKCTIHSAINRHDYDGLRDSYMNDADRLAHMRNIAAMTSMLLAPGQVKFRSISTPDQVFEFYKANRFQIINKDNVLDIGGISEMLNALSIREHEEILHNRAVREYNNYTELSTILGTNTVEKTISASNDLIEQWHRIRNALESGSHLWVDHRHKVTILELLPEHQKSHLNGVTTIQQAWKILRSKNQNMDPCIALENRRLAIPTSMADAICQLENLTNPVFSKMEDVNDIQLELEHLYQCGEKMIESMILSVQAYTSGNLTGTQHRKPEHYPYAMRPFPRTIWDMSQKQTYMKFVRDTSSIQPGAYAKPLKPLIIPQNLHQTSRWAGRALAEARPESIRALGHLLPTWDISCLSGIIPRIMRLV
jgi:hypothetical protein